jgi:hypothetical protein
VNVIFPLPHLPSLARGPGDAKKTGIGVTGGEGKDSAYRCWS